MACARSPPPPVINACFIRRKGALEAGSFASIGIIHDIAASGNPDI
jgi:hypothetical protein